MNTRAKERLYTFGSMLGATGVVHYGLEVSLGIAVMVVITFVALVARIIDHNQTVRESKNAEEQEQSQANSEAPSEPAEAPWQPTGFSKINLPTGDLRRNQEFPVGGEPLQCLCLSKHRCPVHDGMWP